MAEHEEPQLHGYGNGISNSNICERARTRTVGRRAFHTVPLRTGKVLNGLCATLPDVLVDGELEWNVRRRCAATLEDDTEGETIFKRLTCSLSLRCGCGQQSDIAMIKTVLHGSMAWAASRRSGRGE